MKVTDILNELQKRDIDIEISGEKVRLHGPKGNMDESLVELIRTRKSEIIIALSGEADTKKGRPVWCTECEHGQHETDDIGSQVLWCNLVNQAVLDVEKCMLGYWTKNEKGWPVTLQ